MRILLIENDARNTKLIRKTLRANSYAVDICSSGEESMYRIGVNDYDLIVLDIELPDKDGVELIEEIRTAGNETPIIILTARGSVEDRIRGLDAGADDYLIKPFEVLELLARIRAILRRPRSVLLGNKITIGELTIDTAGRRVTASEAEIPLTNKEYALLEYFARNLDRVIGREDISEHVWDENFDPFSNLIEVYINRLRRKLSEHANSPVLRTKRGAGYVLELFTGEIVR